MVAAPPQLYFPIAVKSAPLVADQRAGPEMCMAWSGKFLAAAQADFGWQFYYHSATWRRPSGGAIPVVRAMPADRALFARQLLELRAADYDGLVLLANEPDMADQDDTPPDVLVGLYWYAQRVLYQDATFILPNTIDRAYLDQFLSLTRIRTKDVIRTTSTRVVRIRLDHSRPGRLPGWTTWRPFWRGTATILIG